MSEAGTPREGRREERRRGRFPGNWFIRILLILALAVAVAAWLEMRESWLQAHFFSEWARDSGYRVEPGENPDLWLPTDGPYDQRLGYAQLRSAVPKLVTAGFTVTAQARQNERFRQLTGRGLFPIYREKSQAGLTVLDRSGESLYATLFPQRQYDRFEAIPPVVVSSLLFIENRELLDSDHPQRNPAVEWDRFGRAVIGQAVRAVDPEGASRAGGSTLATQIEKFRHSPGGRTHGAREKLRQMASASLRAYAGGEDTLEVRRRIVVDFVNSVPLGAVPGVGEVNGLGDGLWAWYGREFSEANRLLAAAVEQPAAAAAPFKEALSLFIAQRRPSDLLAENAHRLTELTDSHLRLLARDGVITEALRDAALAVALKPRDTPLPPPPVSFIERKAVNSARAVLADFLDVGNLYALDRYDLTARTTLDGGAQNAVTRFLATLKDDGALKCLGLKGDRLLMRGDPSEVRFSFTLYEATARGNLLRVQADNVDQPLDINVGTKLDLGSSAKFRTLVSYLEAIADLHRRYSPMPPEELRKIRTEGGDNLTRWALEHLQRVEDKSLLPMLEAALERRYPANPQETFFTGGGLHTFHNFKHEDDAKVPTVEEALEQSVNLSFVRIMRDVVHYHAFEAEDAPGRELRDDSEAARRRFLSRFADQEGKEFLAHFFRKYRATATEDLLPALISDLRPLPSRLAAAFLGVEPQADFASFSTFMASQLGERAGSEAQLRKLYATYAPLRLNLSDQGYLARVHPLELWLVGYLKQNPGANFDQVVAASTQQRQEAYRWLLNSRFRRAQDVRIRIALEAAAFERIAASWKKVGYPFERLVPSYATAIGSSADRPAALAELMGIVVNGGVRQATVRVDELHFAVATPFETHLVWTPRAGERVLPAEVAAAARKALLRVVNNGTARRVKDVYKDDAGKPLAVGGKTGTGDHRFDVIGAGGQIKFSRVVNRAATFVFYLGDRFFGTVTAFVPGEQAAAYDFTSALPVQILKEMEPLLRSLTSGQPGTDRTRCPV
ncbi:MAG TPA: transglycosylase domain-containing protein [Rhodocyclaceae bacterium]|nr:transglycosylase domain-containing protein [Rhodocyclaceae bacterium]HNL20904.1 transglycosylase domain-containing protein [Rhodocyclaceae bacterium]HNM21291.1 transglycosylase domain-containing protein [Rhodocyclaceae bacterium]HNM80776.1 transglycosylase domain-containing protein [Rhodocyclaceae bacterium]